MFILLVVFAALALLAAIVYAVNRQTSRTSVDILVALSESRKPLNVTEIQVQVGHRGGMIIQALKFLYRKELISSTHPVRNWEAAMDTGRYAITTKGRRVLKEGSSAL